MNQRLGVRGPVDLAAFACIALLAIALTLPAIYNRFPLVFPDTTAYFSVTYSSQWTLDRAGFYGLFLKPFLLRFPQTPSVWIAIAAQTLCISAILWAVFRRLLPNAPASLALPLLIGVALATSLPWHAAQFLPDAFTGPLVLAVWFAATRDMGSKGTPLLWLLTATLALLHYTHLGLVIACAFACLLVCYLTGTPRREIVKRAVAAMVTVTAVAAAHITIHGAYFGRWTISPLGNYFLFARLSEEGLVPAWMDRHCGVDAPQRLCDLRSEIPADSQRILWTSDSPFIERVHARVGNAAHDPEIWSWIDMMGIAARGSIKEEPMAFLADALRQTGDQLVHFQAADDLCPQSCAGKTWFPDRPAIESQVNASRQLEGTIDKPPIRFVTSITSIIGLLMLLPMVALAIRRRDTLALALLVTIVAALVGNAFMAGALSDVRDRYQSRVVWLAPFAVALLAARFRRRADDLANKTAIVR